jgi:hypothetical protein
METETSFECRERKPGEDITVFMGYIESCVTTDHRRKSPLCRAAKLEYLKLPIGRDGIAEGIEKP